MADASCLHYSRGGISSRTNDQLRIVTGPVNMPFMGFLVSDCAYFHQPIVMGFGRDTSPNRIGGRTHRDPYDCPQPCFVKAKPESCSPKYCTMSLRSNSPWTSSS